jgi:tetratricopeptide (TPR) repeat protein
MKQRRTFTFRTVLQICAAVLILLYAGCGGSEASQKDSSYFISGSEEEKKELSNLFRLLNEEEQIGEPRFSLVSQIADTLLKQKEDAKYNLFLTSYVEKNPDDPFNAYYLLLVAQNYEKKKAYPLAAHYFHRILKNHPDIILHGTPVHQICLKSLLLLTDQPEYRIWYYRELLERFSEHIDLGSTYYEMAVTYEKLGKWEEAYEAYRKFLQYPDTFIPGNPGAYEQVQKALKFHDSAKDWTLESLDVLVNEIRAAIWLRDVNRLLRYKADVNFSARSWEQKDTDILSQTDFEIGIFLARNRIYTDDELDMGSNAREAYLRTWGWYSSLGTWYFYFRRVNYPADPEINGRWEWAGILFGEKF